MGLLSLPKDLLVLFASEFQPLFEPFRFIPVLHNLSFPLLKEYHLALPVLLLGLCLKARS